MITRKRMRPLLVGCCVVSLLFAQNSKGDFDLGGDFDPFIFDDSATSFNVNYDNDEYEKFLSENSFTAIRKSNPEDVIDVLETVGALELLQQNFYLKTYPLNRRNVLDLPSFIRRLHYRYPRYVIGAQLFYDQMSEAYFTSNSGKIGSYIGMNQDTVIEALHNLIDKVKPIYPGFEFPYIDLFDIFANAKVQERRLGLMFHMLRRYKKSQFFFYLPLYYFERNYFLTDEEQDQIEDFVGTTASGEEDDFQKKHLICDKLGFGDSRFIVQYPVLRKREYEIDLGIQVTLPTAFTLVKGMLGSSFKDKKTSQPAFSFIELFDLASNIDTRAEAADKATEFFLQSLDRLSAILLDVGLGNDGHLGVGIIANTRAQLSTFVKRPWAHAVGLKSKISLEYLLPRTRRRYFIEDRSAQRFAEHNFADKNKAADNLAFLEQQFVDKFFPYVLETSIYPGFVFLWTSKIVYENRYGAVHLGSDTWIKTPDRLGAVSASTELLSRLDFKKARGIWGYQTTIFGSLILKTPGKNDDLIVEFNAATTIANKGIGGQFTLGLTIEKNF